jgi:hypothetical protein
MDMRMLPPMRNFGPFVLRQEALNQIVDVSAELMTAYDQIDQLQRLLIDAQATIAKQDMLLHGKKTAYSKIFKGLKELKKDA